MGEGTRGLHAGQQLEEDQTAAQETAPRPTARRETALWQTARRETAHRHTVFRETAHRQTAAKKEAKTIGFMLKFCYFFLMHFLKFILFSCLVFFL